ncbi:MAG: SH3 beta-barrel fold-containing protein [Candidatus Thorarchaeota archaeon]
MADDVIKSAVEFLERIKAEDEVTVKFRKKNNEERIMRCTLNFGKIPKEKHPKDVNLAKILKLIDKHKIIHVYDLDKNDWRSVPFDRTEWLRTAEKQYAVRK